MANYAFSANTSTDVISWIVEPFDVSGTQSVLKCNVSSDVLSWDATKPNGATERFLHCDSATDVISWKDPDSYTWTV